MLGPEGVVTQVLATLKTHLPAKLTEFRTRYGILDTSLEDITRYLTTEPPDIAIDRPPMIVVVEQESDNLEGAVKRSPDGGGGNVYEFRYRIGIFAWARGTTHAGTATARQRYGLAVREVLLQHPGIGVGDPGLLVIDPLTLVETYSGVAVSAPSREIIAGTGITVQYRAQEYLEPRTPPRPVTAIDSDTTTGPTA